MTSFLMISVPTTFLLLCVMGLRILVEAHSPWLDDCRQDGFDPFQLACRTCELLPTTHLERCTECCQSYKDVNHRTKPYESAVLVLPTEFSMMGVDSEVTQFLDEDWSEIITTKGDHRLRKVQDRAMDVNPVYGYFGGAKVELLFFEAGSAGTGGSYKELRAASKENISLVGLKRDDIKDMLSTLLV